MNARPPLLGALLLAGIVLAGCTAMPATTTSATTGAVSSTNAPAAQAQQVTIQGLAFSPANLQVAAGSTVTWVNQDTMAHTVTADDGSFDSGVLAPGASFTHTFASAGTVGYHCKIHSTMTAQVLVSGDLSSTGMPASPSTPMPSAGGGGGGAYGP